MTTKIAVITGGGTGIGRQISIELARIGVKIIVFGRTEATLIETITLIDKVGGDADYFIGDVGDIESVASFGAFIRMKYDHIDILVNNAGIDIAGPFTELSYEKWNRLLSTNLTGPYLICKEFVPSMISRSKGIIINISSILGIKGIANFSGYSATKSGIRGFSEALSDELSSFGIKVYCICPGRTSTDMQLRLGGRRVAQLSMHPQVVSKIVKSIVEGNRAFQTIIIINRRSIALFLYDWSLILKSMLRRLLNPFISLMI